MSESQDLTTLLRKLVDAAPAEARELAHQLITTGLRYAAMAGHIRDTASMIAPSPTAERMRVTSAALAEHAESAGRAALRVLSVPAQVEAFPCELCEGRGVATLARPDAHAGPLQLLSVRCLCREAEKIGGR